ARRLGPRCPPASSRRSPARGAGRAFRRSSAADLPGGRLGPSGGPSVSRFLASAPSAGGTDLAERLDLDPVPRASARPIAAVEPFGHNSFQTQGADLPEELPAGADDPFAEHHLRLA